MEREEEDVVAIVEDRLGAVAMVIVDIEDRNPRGTPVDEGLGGDGGIVQEAIAAVIVLARMMARRPAEGEGGSARRRSGSPPAVNATSAAERAARQVPAVIGVLVSKQ